MARLTKKQGSRFKIEPNKVYSVVRLRFNKRNHQRKFDASVDIAVRLNVDPRKANQMVRGVVTLPHGTGRR